jgi:hypothetical protein
MDWWWVVIIAGAGVYVIGRLFRGSVKHSAVQNAFLAKYTYDQLSDAEQKQVQERTLEIMKRGGLLHEDFANIWAAKLMSPFQAISSFQEVNTEMVKFCFVAFAMEELGIPPALPNEQWHYVKRPLFALRNCQHQIDLVNNHLVHTHRVHVTFG